MFCDEMLLERCSLCRNGEDGGGGGGGARRELLLRDQRFRGSREVPSAAALVGMGAEEKESATAWAGLV